MADLFHRLMPHGEVRLSPGGMWELDGEPVELDEILCGLPRSAWDSAVAAHLQAVKDSVRHLAALQLGLRTPSGTGPICAACVAEPIHHLVELSDHIDEMARQLAMVTVRYDLVLFTG